MNQTPNSQTPSAVEYTGYYNVDPDVLRPDDPWDYLCITKGLVRPNLDEMWEVNDLIAEFVKNEIGTAEDDLYCDARSDDRTVYFNFGDLKDLTLKNLNGLKQLLKKRAPNWRIAVMGNKPETTIIIYPSKIAFSVKGNDQELTDAIRTELIEYEDKTTGEAKRQLDRQVAWISHLLRNHPPQNLDLSKSPEVLAVFANGAGEEEFRCIWFISGDGGRFMPDWWPSRQAKLGYYTGGGKYDISLDGKLHPSYELKKGELLGLATPLWVEKEKYTKIIKFKSKWDWDTNWLKKLSKPEQELLPKAGKIVELNLEGFEMITDEELKKKLAGIGQ